MNRLAEGAAIVAATSAIAVLGILVWGVAVRGISALNLDFFTKGPALFGETGGGIAPAIVGSALLVAIATIIALPFGVLIALYVSEFAPKRIADQVRLWLDVLNGFPSIVIGIFVFTLVVKASIPILGHRAPPERDRRRVRAVDHHAAARRAFDDGGPRTRPERAPRGEATRSASRSGRPSFGVVLPTSFGGILTGTTLAIARAAGETAPLLFTCAIAGKLVDWNPAHSVQSMPLTIFTDSESADPNLHTQAWATAFVLIVFVLVTSLTARFLLDRQRRKLGLSR